MPLQFRCPGCGATIQVREEHAGKQARCPNCRSISTAPAATATAGPALGSMPPVGAVDTVPVVPVPGAINPEPRIPTLAAVDPAPGESLVVEPDAVHQLPAQAPLPTAVTPHLTAE